MRALHITMLVTAIAFFWYGLSCIFSQKMREEFIRFGLSKYRVLTGILQLVGAIGLIIGIYNDRVGTLACFGLALLMLLGFITRLHIKDGILKSAPSFLLMLLNLYMGYYNYITL